MYVRFYAIFLLRLVTGAALSAPPQITAASDEMTISSKIAADEEVHRIRLCSERDELGLCANLLKISQCVNLAQLGLDRWVNNISSVRVFENEVQWNLWNGPYCSGIGWKFFGAALFVSYKLSVYTVCTKN
ncbi:hypothetical protein BT63DRAFT_96729 [Microthyrium microscopicum]|uniref:Uncharacterized protein n=1 Tax=Microthyrium microscopicum TaxID=703497 RepID=A0A6A6U0S8_9PEZI|nr:hypothetical protein BT63DRAFT_96729 [Microthyrium microscopicum]